MKKFLSFAMALAMTASLVPATAFAATDARVSRVITAEDDDDLFDGNNKTKEAPNFILKAKDDFDRQKQEFEVQLENAEWLEDDNDVLEVVKDGVVYLNPKSNGHHGTSHEDLAALKVTEAEKLDAYNAKKAITAEKLEVFTDAGKTVDEVKTILDAATDAETALTAAIAAESDAKTANSAGSPKFDAATAIVVAYEGTYDESASPNFGFTSPDEYLTETAKYEDANAILADLQTAEDEATAAVATATTNKAAADQAVTDLGVEQADINAYESAYAEEQTAKGEYDAAKAAVDNFGGSVVTIDVTKRSATTIIVSVEGQLYEDDEIVVPLYTTLTGGTATVSVDNKDSEFTSETKTFAKTVDGATKFSIEKTKNFQDGDEMENFFIEEITAGTFEAGKTCTVRLHGGFEFKKEGTITVIAGDRKGETIAWDYAKDKDNDDAKDEIEFKFLEEVDGKSEDITQIRFSGFKIDEGDAEFGDVAELSIKGGGVSEERIEVGTYSDYGIKMDAEDKELPVIYAGTKADKENDNKTLKVVIEETVAGSFIADRKLELKLPEGVEFSDSTDAGRGNGIDDDSKSFKITNISGKKSDFEKDFKLKDDGDVITISEVPDATGKDKKRKIELAFNISAEADFTGDVDLTLTGPGIANEELTTTIATVKAPIEVKAGVNELKLDYRDTEASDITIVEPAAGVWSRGDSIYLKVENMTFESGIKAEVVNGDMTLEKLDGDYVDVEKGKKDTDAYIRLQVDKESSKEPAEIKISGIKLYMERNLPAGDYELTVFGNEKNDTFMNNYEETKADEKPGVFDTDEITVLKDYVKVVTAGRDQDDATFTTKITVPVGADKIMAGTKEIALDAPAYINKDGYTMLPVRAVTEALNGVAAIKWDDATKTATINFGQRVFSMTVNSKVMNINGVQTNLLAAPEIKNERIFLPLRDLGYALGLQDDKINWDSATSTATLN